jgi:hypothetical protein
MCSILPVYRWPAKSAQPPKPLVYKPNGSVRTIPSGPPAESSSLADDRLVAATETQQDTNRSEPAESSMILGDAPSRSAFMALLKAIGIAVPVGSLLRCLPVQAEQHSKLAGGHRSWPLL